jgi:hypothetical protein
MIPSSNRPKLGGAFTQATPFEGLRLLAPGEPNAPAPTAPLRSVPGTTDPDQDDDHERPEDTDQADPPSEDQQAAIVHEAAGVVNDRGSAAGGPPDPGIADDDAAAEAATRAKNTPSKRAPRARVAGSGAAANPGANNVASTQLAIKMVPVNIDASVHTQLRQFAARTELPFSVIVLRAIEADAAELAVTWKSSPTPKSGGLFQMVDHRTRNRRTEPFAQIQLRLTATDAEVLEGLISDWGAPSRSALVNEALRRYVMSGDR